VESRNSEGFDQLVVHVSKVSSQDIASFPQRLKELDGVRDASVKRKANG
jgi:putative Mg2+ transporter-C (MgtC) family protein